MAVRTEMKRRSYIQLLGDAADAHFHWRRECLTVWEAYARWANAPSHEARSAFAGYRAALEREERAAEVYADLQARVARSPDGRVSRGAPVRAGR